MEKGHYSVLRVSHLSQIGNFSIEQQKGSIEAYATLHSIEITEHLAECGSGTTGERKQIQTLYRLIEEDRVEGILCYKLDRIFRNMKLSIDFISICVEKGIKIHSVAESISTDTPEVTSDIYFSWLTTIRIPVSVVVGFLDLTPCKPGRLDGYRHPSEEADEANSNRSYAGRGCCQGRDGREDRAQVSRHG